MKNTNKIVISILSLIIISCVPEVSIFSPGDLAPPSVCSWSPISEKSLIVQFDEELDAEIENITVSPQILVESVTKDDKSIHITFNEAQEPGMLYSISGIVRDSAGNCANFVLPFWGYNPNPAVLIFNELVTEGSGKKPDCIEFFVKKSGNTAGLALFFGSDKNFDSRYVFKNLEVKEGDYIIFHCKPTGAEDEVDEKDSKASSKGFCSSDEAWDLWSEDGQALSGKNGVLSLLDSPIGNYQDVIAYSERTSLSDTKYDGFGTNALLSKIKDIAEVDEWVFSEKPCPEDCASSSGTTSTRSICRSSTSIDTNSREDWHIVPTSSSSLGKSNTDEVFK